METWPVNKARNLQDTFKSSYWSLTCLFWFSKLAYFTLTSVSLMLSLSHKEGVNDYMRNFPLVSNLFVETTCTNAFISAISILPCCLAYF